MLRGGGKSLLKYYLRPTKYQVRNWWNTDADGFWLSRFMEHYFCSQKRILLCSCFDYMVPWLNLSRSVRIFVSGENLQSNSVVNRMAQYSGHRLGEVDLALGFEFRQEQNYYRFPQWIWYRDFIRPEATLEDIKDKIERINDPALRLNKGRTRFIAQISSHDTSGERGVLIDLLSPLGQIDCAGRFRQNTTELQDRYNDVKEDFLANYKFNICPENSLGEGYTTEKIFESIVAGCIPIYWGSYLEDGILNPKAILRYEKGKEQELYAEVERLWTDKKAYREFALQPPFVDGAAERIWEIIEGLKQRLEPILKE